MQKIDRLGWADGFAFISYGVPIGVRANSAEALRLLRERFPPGWKSAALPVVDRLYSFVLGTESGRPGVQRFNLLYGDIARLARTRRLDEALDVFESNLQLYVAEAARRRVFVHAGVVGWKGRAIVVPGRSFTGKTSLVAALVRAGATYYSDEYAVLDARGRVHPYPKPLQLREDRSARQQKYPVEAFGGRAGVKPLPVGLVIVSKYRAGAKWRARTVSAGRGSLELLANTVSARRRPEAALSALQQVVAQAPVVKSVRGEADETTGLILEYLDSLKEKA
ncbi:MAG TPA: hypothetical protein VF723_03165 [Pyrinomonadaceae bacterium]|jgi:hypothetical protein